MPRAMPRKLTLAAGIAALITSASAGFMFLPGGEDAPAAAGRLPDEQAVGYVLNQAFEDQGAPYRVSLVSGCADGWCRVVIRQGENEGCFRIEYRLFPNRYLARFRDSKPVQCASLAG